MNIISFDPASHRNCGWAFLNICDDLIASCDAGTFVVKKHEEPWMSCWPIFEFADNLIKEKKPDIIIVEKTSSFRTKKFNFVGGQVSNIMGVLLALCGKYGLKVVFEYPTHVRKILLGRGKGTKTEMKNVVSKWMIENGIKIDTPSEHAADALANIICYLKESKK